MINFDSFSLENGLRVIVHRDESTPLTAMNILYDVGSRDEDPEMTGLAHLFEHLMFGGTRNIPEYDTPLQLAGGENNAFTNNDITNYYLTVPAENIETGFWLESDRMDELDFSQRNLDIQKSVVTEEFNQRYKNQPYGDSLLLLRPLAFKVHPYRWPTIGLDINHVKNSRLEHIREFFFSHYAPNNAIIAVAGNVTTERIRALSEKWFGPVPRRKTATRNIPAEPTQTSERIMTVERNVPSDAIYKAWHVCPRTADDFYVMDLLSDILAGGESGRLYTKLVRGKNLFSEINAFLTADIDPGLMVVTGKLMEGVRVEDAERSVNDVINELLDKVPDPGEIEKVKNKFESSSVLLNTGILHKAMNLAFCELIGDPALINTEVERYRSTDGEMVMKAARKYLNPENCSTLYYLSSKKEQE
jgi:zinc protease